MRFYNIFGFLILGFVFLAVSGCSSSDALRKDQKTSVSSSSNLTSGPIHLFRKFLSGGDGDRCPMVPSCSTYCLQAIEKHGSLLGYVMCADRLTRCGRDEVRLGKKLWIKDRLRIHDPVENNDFWWETKDEKHGS